jgi:hypothetical protein
MLQIDPRNQPPTSQDGQPGADKQYGGDSLGVWMTRARNSYRASTTYVDNNYRKAWDDGIRAFNNQHSGDSKYNSPSFDKRSRLFRPKTRSIIRKNEAAAAAAFFSNMDVVSLSASDQSNPAQMASAEVMKELLQYRLTRTIPWFQVVLGGLQDAQTVGAACAHVHWKYDKVSQPNLDQPAIDLIPIENCRFDPNASWIDPVNSSPYFIQLIPMYKMDIQSRIDAGDWADVPLVAGSTAMTYDTTRISRAKGAEDAVETQRQVNDYDVFWVQRHIHRKDGQDWTFYTLGDLNLLSEPIELSRVVFHGKRPYVIGSCILETHKPMPAGVPQLSKGLQDEANEIANQRIDNVKFALNKKWFAKRGVEVDLGGLVRNVPGGVVMMNDPTNDVREITWPDVTASSYEEQNRINVDMDELLGNFNPAGLLSQGGMNAPARNMALLSQSNGTLVEYLIRTFVETFVQPVLRLLVLTEQQYETDQVILNIAAKSSKLLQRAGQDQVTDQLLQQEVTLAVNVGMGATDPAQKLQKFLTAMGSFTAMMQHPTPGINMVEVGKEIFGHLGYQDGSRFFTMENPEVAVLQKTIMQQKMLMAQMQKQIDEKNTGHMIGLQKTRETNQTKERIAGVKEVHTDKRHLASMINDLMSEDRKAENERKNGSGNGTAKK